jgi:hypothetical protein
MIGTGADPGLRRVTQSIGLKILDQVAETAAHDTSCRRTAEKATQPTTQEAA